MYIGKIKTGKSYKKIIGIFLAISIILIVFVVYASFSKAKIKIMPASEIESIDYEIKVEPDQDIDLVQLQNINGRVMQIELEETQKITDVPRKETDAKAKGKVTIINNLDQAQPLIPRTQLQSESGAIFRIDERVAAPAHSRTEVTVTADQEGPGSNIGPGKFTVVKLYQHWQNLLYAESTENMTGGTIETEVVTQEVIDQARVKVNADLFRKGINELKSQLDSDEEIVEAAAKQEVVNWKASVEPDTKTSEFEITMELKITAVVFNEQTLTDLSIAKLKKNISDNKEFVECLSDNTSYDVTEYSLEENWAKLKVHLEGTTIAKISDNALDKDQLTGRNKDEVIEYYNSLPDVVETEVTFSPFWIRTVPSLKDHIEIIIEK